MSKKLDALFEWLLREGVHLANADEVYNYIIQFPGVVAAILGAVRAAKKHFPEAALMLDVYRDPEIEDAYLRLYIKIDRDERRIDERMDKVESAFIDLLSDTRGWLQLTLKIITRTHREETPGNERRRK